MSNIDFGSVFSEEAFDLTLDRAAKSAVIADNDLGLVSSATLSCLIFRQDLARLNKAAEKLQARDYKRVLAFCKAACGGMPDGDLWMIGEKSPLTAKAISFASTEALQECQAFWRSAMDRLVKARCLTLTRLEGFLTKPKKANLVKAGAIAAFAKKIDKALANNAVETEELTAAREFVRWAKENHLL